MLSVVFVVVVIVAIVCFIVAVIVVDPIVLFDLNAAVVSRCRYCCCF